MEKSKANKQRLGERLVAEFSELRDTILSKTPLEKRYTVRTVQLPAKPKHFDAAAIRAIRESFGVSQAVFAHLLAVSSDLVGAWEQGHRVPSGPVCRLLELMESDRSRWQALLLGRPARKSA